ncbi:MAG: hypothetical protein ACOXZH_00165 [Bacteroidales bacterium]|jgi:hypothetical protein
MAARINKLRYYKIIVDIVKAHYVPGLTTYAGVWREFVYPFYPMSYQTFMRIIAYPKLNLELEELERKEKEAGQPRMNPTPKNQLDLFEKFKKE